MKNPLPFSALVEAGENENKNTLVEIYLNRSGINSIEVPGDHVRAVIGTTLSLKFVNRGSPIHITATASNAGMFTGFFHENLYILDEAILPIPIKNECQPGFFDVEIIAGYGVMKASLRVDVDSPVDWSAHVRVQEVPIQPVAHGRPHFLMVMMGIALILYATWLYNGTAVLNTAAFVFLIIGALYTWYRQG
jgi:hypothetical protein